MSIGFKEWALVCEALGRGEQSIILRKGGIAEGRAGFRFQHARFVLLPTLFHEQAEKLKVPPGTAVPRPREDGCLEVRYQAEVEWTEEIADWESARRLSPFHSWQESVIEERFRYQSGGSISLAFVRVTRLTTPFVFPDSPKYGGCRSWVQLPDLPPDITASPVLSEEEHRRREVQIQAVRRSSSMGAVALPRAGAPV